MKFCHIVSSMVLFVTITVVFGVSLTSWSLAFAVEREGLQYIPTWDSDTPSVIENSTNTAGAPIAAPIAVGDGPVGIAFDPAHNRVYVTNIANNSVSVIDTNTTIPET